HRDPRNGTQWQTEWRTARRVVVAPAGGCSDVDRCHAAGCARTLGNRRSTVARTRRTAECRHGCWCTRIIELEFTRPATTRMAMARRLRFRDAWRPDGGSLPPAADPSGHAADVPGHVASLLRPHRRRTLPARR